MNSKIIFCQTQLKVEDLHLLENLHFSLLFSEKKIIIKKYLVGKLIILELL